MMHDDGRKRISIGHLSLLRWPKIPFFKALSSLSGSNTWLEIKKKRRIFRIETYPDDNVEKLHKLSRMAYKWLQLKITMCAIFI